MEHRFCQAVAHGEADSVILRQQLLSRFMKNGKFQMLSQGKLPVGYLVSGRCIGAGFLQADREIHIVIGVSLRCEGLIGKFQPAGPARSGR